MSQTRTDWLVFFIFNRRRCFKNVKKKKKSFFFFLDDKRATLHIDSWCYLYGVCMLHLSPYIHEKYNTTSRVNIYKVTTVEDNTKKLECGHYFDTYWKMYNQKCNMKCRKKTKIKPLLCDKRTKLFYCWDFYTIERGRLKLKIKILRYALFRFMINVPHTKWKICFFLCCCP